MILIPTHRNDNVWKCIQSYVESFTVFFKHHKRNAPQTLSIYNYTMSLVLFESIIIVSFSDLYVCCIHLLETNPYLSSSSVKLMYVMVLSTVYVITTVDCLLYNCYLQYLAKSIIALELQTFFSQYNPELQYM